MYLKRRTSFVYITTLKYAVQKGERDKNDTPSYIYNTEVNWSV